MKKEIAIVSLLLTALCGRGHAGPDAEEPQRDAVSLLQSNRPEDAAWGAWLAGRDGRREAESLLLRLLLPHPERTSREWEFAHLAVVDALVVTGAKVPGEVLLPHARGRTAIPALILLSRDVARNRDALLTLFEHHGPKRGSLTWLAAGNLLAKSRAPGFTACALEHLKMELDITVSDSESIFGLGSGSVSMRFGDGRVVVPEGFPPTAVYRLHAEQKDGCELLAEGPRPVYYLRTVRQESRFGTGSGSRSISGTACVLEWLSGLLGAAKGGIPLKERSRASILWDGPEAYVGRAAGARDAILDRYWSMIRILFDKKLLSEAEAAKCSPNLKVLVSDRRVDRTVVLPDLPQNRKRPDFSR